MNSKYQVLDTENRRGLVPSGTLAFDTDAALRQEISDLKKMLVQSDKMAATGMLFAQFFHEASNHMMVVTGNLSLLVGHDKCLISKLLSECKQLESDLPDHDKSASFQGEKKCSILKNLYKHIGKTSEIINEAMGGAEQLCSILNDVKMFSRADMNQLVDVDLNERLNFISKMILSVHKNKIAIIKDYRNIPTIKGSPQKIGQAFMNILLNAQQAIAAKGTKGTIVVATRYIPSKEENDGKSWIEVIFSDTGCGIPKDKGAIIFEPFFSTKPVGLGLGLHITNEIIKECGGTIAIDSIEGQGTNVTVRIPVS